MRIYDIIKRKRDGAELTEEEISFFTQSVTNGFASDEQTGAFLMAVYFNGMTRAETLALTNAMAKSGDRLDLSGWGRAWRRQALLRRSRRQNHACGGSSCRLLRRNRGEDERARSGLYRRHRRQAGIHTGF